MATAPGTLNWLQRQALRFAGLQVEEKADQAPLVERYLAGNPIMPDYDVLQAVESDMERNPFLYSALKRKADAVAAIPFFVEKREGSDWVRQDQHPAETLLESGNPNMSGATIKRYWVYHKELTGSAYSQIARSTDGKPVFLQPLFPQFMNPVPDRVNYLKGFEYTIDGEKPRPFRPEQVFWTKHDHPKDPYKGLSPLRAIFGEIQVDQAAIQWNVVGLTQRGATDAAFILKDVKTQQQYTDAKRMILDRYGGPDNARAPWILGGDSDVRPLSYSAVEMDYLNTRIFNRQVIGAALGVPAPLIGDADNSTYNNLDTLKRVFWEDTITPYLEEIRQDLTRQVLLRYYRDGRASKPNIRYMYDLSNVEALAENWVERAEIAKLLAAAGFSADQINERFELGMDPALAAPDPVAAAPAPGGDPAQLNRWATEVTDIVESLLLTGLEPQVWLPRLNAELASALGGTPDEEAARTRAERVYAAVTMAKNLGAGSDRLASMAGQIAKLEVAHAARSAPPGGAN